MSFLAPICRMRPEIHSNQSCPFPFRFHSSHCYLFLSLNCISNALDKRNVGPRQTPDWTPELLDEYTAQQGKAISWAKKARMGEFLKDPDEDLTQMPIIFRVYCALTAFEIAFAYGRSTPTFLLQSWNLQSDQTQGFMSVFQSLGLALCVGAIGGGVVCGALLAPEKNRSSFVWGVKGLIAGPLAVRQLRELDALITRGEKEEAMKE